MSEPRARGFPPLVGQRPRALILGSLPGVASIRAVQYYGHPRNAFWPITGALFGFDATASYESRTAALTQAGIALWDVLASAERPGSLDSAIAGDTAESNDIAALLTAHPTIDAVFLNGGKAEALYRRHVVGGVAADVPYRRLPSSSPAYAAMRFDAKLAAWRDAIAATGLLVGGKARP